MAKTKKNRAGLSEKIAHKNLKSKAAKLNPFDIRFVKSKQKILGRREKNDVGKPGIARAKAIQKVRIQNYLILFKLLELERLHYFSLKCLINLPVL